MHGENHRLTRCDIASSSEVLWFVREQLLTTSGVVSAYIGEGLGQVMGLFGEVVQELSFRDAIRRLFGENQLVVLKLNRRDLSGAR